MNKPAFPLRHVWERLTLVLPVLEFASSAVVATLTLPLLVAGAVCRLGCLHGECRAG